MLGSIEFMVMLTRAQSNIAASIQDSIKLLRKSDLVSGVFVASEIDWQAVTASFKVKGYKSTSPDATEQEVLAELKLRNIVPIRELTKDFSSYCNAKVVLETSSRSEEEVKGYITQFFMNNNIPQERGIPIFEWLTERKGKQDSSQEKLRSAFYDVVKFDITCSFDMVEFFLSSEHARSRFKEIDKWTTFAIDLLERVSEQQVYSDLCGGFDNSKTSPFVQFPIKTNLQLNVEMDESQPIKLGRTFTSKAKIVNKTGKTLNVSKSDIVFDGEPPLKAKIQSLKADPFIVEMDNESLKLEDDQTYTVTLRFKPNPTLLRQGLMPQRPKVTIQLVDTSTSITMLEQTKEFPLENPDLNVNIDGPRWTHRGMETRLQFFYQLAPKTYGDTGQVEIPVAVTMASTDIDYIYPSSEEAKQFKLTFTNAKKMKNADIVFKPKQMAGKLAVYYQFTYASELQDSNDWQTKRIGLPLNKYVFPNRLPDATGFFIPFIFALAHVIWPDIVPQLAPELNVPTLSSVGAGLFLLYRFYSWLK